MTDQKTYYVTSPIYYVNSVPHIGHAYTTIACDVMARWKRLDGYNVKYLTGTDEHGQKVEAAAVAKGLDPKAHCDSIAASFKALAEAVGSSHDRFIRTTDEDHKRAVQALWNKLLETGNIYLGSYSGWYSVRDEAYFDEEELTTNEGGEKLAPTGAPVEWVEEASYFFKLSAWAEPLIAHFEANPDAIAPKSRFNEVMSFLKGGLRDLSISRTTFEWGIPIPQNAEGDEKHIVYVWLDALTNYITALGYPDQMDSHWPADLHIVGKDILRFHAVYWPAFLMAAELPVAKRVYAHGWWTNEGEKISKSLGNVIDPYELIDSFGLDQTRYFVLREVPFGNDADYSRSAMITRMNSDLANAWGNLVQRTLSLVFKNCDAQLPAPGELTDEDRALQARCDGIIDAMRPAMDRQAFKDALEVAWATISAANEYIDHQAPWSLKKTDPERMKTVLYVLTDGIRQIALALQPFMPDSQSKVLDLLEIASDDRGFEAISRRMAPGTGLPKPAGVFPRFVEETAAS